jgi:Ni,Fe-hydrogenase I large subunit
MDRLEGHLDIEATTDASTIITAVENQVVMFRGIENIMTKRDPRDAPIIAPRT